jgi:hypothetical protein
MTNSHSHRDPTSVPTHVIAQAIMLGMRKFYELQQQESVNYWGSLGRYTEAKADGKFPAFPPPPRGSMELCMEACPDYWQVIFAAITNNESHKMTILKQWYDAIKKEMGL